MKLCTNCKFSRQGDDPEESEIVARCCFIRPVFSAPYWLARKPITHKENAQAERCGCYERREGWGWVGVDGAVGESQTVETTFCDGKVVSYRTIPYSPELTGWKREGGGDE